MTGDREAQLQAMTRCLNSPDGELLMAELAVIWNPPVIFTSDTAALAHACALRDAYHLLLELKARGAQ